MKFDSCPYFDCMIIDIKWPIDIKLVAKCASSFQDNSNEFKTVRWNENKTHEITKLKEDDMIFTLKTKVKHVEHQSIKYCRECVCRNIAF